MKSRLLNLFVPLFGLFVAFGIVEVAIRFLVPAGKGQSPTWNDRPLFYYRSPAQPTMQDYPHEAVKPPSTFRIAVVGDSFTFAPYMQFTDTFAKRLEQILNVTGGPLKAEVINYGVPAYSTSHEIGVVKTAIEEDADLIILQITLNDPELKLHRPTGIREDMDDPFGPIQFNGPLGRVARHWRTLGFALTRIHNTQSHNAYIDYYKKLYDNPRTYKPFRDAMRGLVGTAKKSKTQLVAVVFPLFGLPMNDNYPFYEIHQKLDDLLTKHEVPHLDISDIYKGIPLERLQVIPGVDRHPNEIAHRMAAEKIYLWLESEKRIPQELLLTEKFATRLGTEGNRPLEP